MRQPSSFLDDPASDWFALSGFTGRGFDTRREDAVRLEGILANSGDLDLTATEGPTGYWGTALDTAVRRYQKRNGLKVDGWLRPGGPTIAHMRDTLGSALDGFEVPTPDEIDAHHAALDAGGTPLIAVSPKTDLAAIPGLPDIGEAGRGSNASQIDWLLRNQAGLGSVPAQFARYVTGLGDEGLAQTRDFVAQYAARRPAGNDALVAGILRELPDDESRARFLGRPLGDRVPAGIRTMDHRPERDGVPQMHMRNLLLPGDETGQATPAADGGDAASDPQTAQAPAERPPLGPDKAVIAPNIDAFAQSVVGGRQVGESKECVALVKHALPDIGATPNWRAGDTITGPGNPPLQPGTAVATFAPDPTKNGELRYPNKPTGNHAGLFMGYGEKDGEPGIWLLDQSRGHTPRQSFMPFERVPGTSGYTAGQFSIILPPTRK
ncbi:MAG: peptidoglycan-binding protein [Rhodospirillales bacterium]|nr:peptidoglycan-binding protein [Rhodospirillales bacterium]